MNDNYGDFLLFMKVMNECEKFKDYYDVYSSEVDEDFYKKFIKFKCLEKKEAIEKADIAILAGGGYFGEPDKLRLLWNLRFIFKHALPIYKLIRKKTPICIVGIGFGPLNFFFSRKIAVKIFNKAQLVAVRDIESKKYLEKYGVSRAIEVIPDWIMSCDKDTLCKDRQSFSRFKNRWLIHLTSKFENKDDSIGIVINDIIKLINEGEQFAIITDQSNEKQRKRALIIQNTLGLDEDLVYFYKDPYELSKIISDSKGVITDKLHVGIVATRFEKKVIAVNAHPKTKRFYNQINYAEECIPLKNVKKDDVYEKFKKLNSIEINIEEIVSKSKNNETLLASFLEDNK